MILFKVLICIGMVFAKYGKAATDIIKRHEVLRDDIYNVEWTVDFEEEDIEFQVTARTKGFVGFGISYTGSMQHADIVIGGVFENGSTYFSDYHGDRTNGRPLMDEKQNWNLLSASENETHTSLSFNRKLNTCDNEDIAINNDTLKIIWSFGKSDDISYHGSTNRGALSVYFLESPSEATDLSKFLVWRTAQVFEMPAVDTTYWCTYFKAPQLSEKHHVVGFDVFLNGSNSKQHTHHADLYKCHPPKGQNIDKYFSKYLGYGYDCYYSDKYHPSQYCELLEYQWSIGGKVTMFPDNVGIPIGEDSSEYYLTIIHYDNPHKLAGLQVHSGMEMYYTDQLREHDGGILGVGIRSSKTYSITIPPNSQEFVVSCHCPSECTSNLPEDGINAFIYLLHSHLSGRKQKLRHFRGDKELPYIANDEHYDFHYQNNRHFRTELKLLPGDHLTLDILNRHEVLRDDIYNVEWTVDFDEEKIEFQITTRTKGFVGFGISYTGSMQYSDIIIGGVFDNGTTYFSDYHGDTSLTNGKPLIDEKQSWNLLGASENSTHTKLLFNRKLNTCDDEDIAVTNDTLKIIWSFGNTDDISYHGNVNRGALSVNFLDPPSEATDLSKFLVWRTAQALEIPAVDTTYWCTYFKAPQFSKKHHVVGFNIFLNGRTSKQHTHHADLYKCQTPNGEDIDEYFSKYLGYGYDCYFSNEYHPVEHCQLFESQWSIGGKVTMFPDNVGIPIGEVSNEYYMTEIHYDNPQEVAGLQVHSGMEMYYTDELREHDGGFLQVGVMTSKIYSLTIPPNSQEFVVSSHCPSECTSNLPEDGVNAFVYLLHSHLSGRKEKIRHFRGEKELPYIANDEHYDFNYQNNRHFRTELKLLPNDHLTLECTYDTTWKNGKATLGGRSARDEMCQTFLMYYPRVLTVNQCGSYVAQESILEYMQIGSVTNVKGVIDPTILEPENLKGTLYSKYIEDGITWTAEKREEFQNFTRFGKHKAYCIPFNASDSFMEIQYPKVEKEYQVINTCNAATTQSIFFSSILLSGFAVVWRLLYAE